jgi:hypothetical protein
MLSVIMLNVVLLNVSNIPFMKIVFMLCVVMFNAIMLSLLVPYLHYASLFQHSLRFAPDMAHGLTLKCQIKKESLARRKKL